MDSTKKRPQRQAVLIVSHPDGYIEAFAEPHIDVRFARVPVAHSLDAEVVAEDLVELMLPARYRRLYFPAMRRTVGSTRPLTVDALLAAFGMMDATATLNAFEATAHGSEAA